LIFSTGWLRLRLGGWAEDRGNLPFAFAQDDGAFIYFAEVSYFLLPIIGVLTQCA